MQNLVETAATSYSDLAQEAKEELEGMIFVAYNAQSFDILDDYSFTQIKDKPAACFVFGDIVGSSYLRLSKSARDKYFKVTNLSL